MKPSAVTCHLRATRPSVSLVLSSGGGIAFVVAESLTLFLSVTADFSFPRSSFELARLTLSLRKRSPNIVCIYRPPPDNRKEQKDLFFME